jgi:hypothetical protein
MASPTVGSTNKASANSNVFTHPISLPASISAGDLLLVIWGKSGGSSSNQPYIDIVASGKKWFQIPQQYTSLRGSISIFWKVAEGSDALTLLTDVATPSNHLSYRITGHGSAVWAALTDHAAGTNADPPSASNTGGAQDMLAIAIACCPGTIVASAAPSGYGSLLTNTGTTFPPGMSGATKALTAATTEDPGTFTTASAAWGAATILIASTGITVNARETQEVAETLSTVDPNAVITQEAVEVLSANALYAVVTQVATEVLSSNDGSTRSRRVIVIGT